MLNKQDFINLLFNNEDNKKFEIKASNLVAYNRVDDIDVWNYNTCIAIVFPKINVMHLNVHYYSSTTQRNQYKLIKRARRHNYTIISMNIGEVFEHDDASKKTLALYQ